MTPEEADALEAQLERQFRTSRSTHDVAGRTIELLHPANADDLITEADYVKDERLPYWADVWPSSLALAGGVARLDGHGRRALELGCGLGLVATAAARAGFAVLATDYYEDALLFARRNVWRNAAASIETRHVDWRHFPADLGNFDLVLASDVLYEREYATLLAYAFDRTLAPDGVGLLADPGRIAVDAFVEECMSRRLDVQVIAQVPYQAGEVRQTIAIRRIARR